MKNVLILLIILFSETLMAQTPLIASCCDTNPGRCTGSAYCTACSNCSRCAHCSSGGSCGVCSSGQTYNPTPKRKARKNNFINYTSAPTFSPESGDIFSVASAVVNLRVGPGTEYDIIEKVGEGEMVTFHQLTGNWAYITVRSTGTKGYINIKYLQ